MDFMYMNPAANVYNGQSFPVQMYIWYLSTEFLAAGFMNVLMTRTVNESPFHIVHTFKGKSW